MLVLDVHNHKTYVKNADSNDLELIKKALTVFKQKFMTSIYSEQKWDITYLFSYRDYTFPTGYLSELLKYCEENNIQVDVTDNRKYKGQYLFKLNIRKTLELRVDQKEAYEEIKDHNVGIISMPTATGKSRLIVKTIELRKVRTLILVPTSNLQSSMTNLCKNLFGNARVDSEIPQELIEKIKRGLIHTEEDIGSQFKKDKPSAYGGFIKQEPEEKTDSKNRFSGFSKSEDEEAEEKPNRFSGFSKEEKISNPEDKYLSQKKKESFKKKIEKAKLKAKKKLEAPVKYKDIYVFCYASLKTLPQEFINQFDMIIIDEAHHSSSNEVRDFLLKAKNACYRYFFTATPWRDHSADQKLLIASIGTNIIYELSPERAIELGSIAKPEFVQLSADTPSQFIPQSTRKYRDTLEAGIIGNKSRNKQIVDLAMKEYNNGENVFINVDEISHIEILQERFKERGVNVDIIHSKLNKKNNERTILEVGERKTGISLGTMSVGEGTDMPNLSVIILASGGKSSIRLIQRIGRGARLGLDFAKKSFKVYDFFDWFHPTLMRHAQTRKFIYEDYFKNWGQ